MTSQAGSMRRVVGAMTGTSMDGIDASLVRIEGRGLAMRVVPLRHASRPLGPLGDELRAAAAQAPLPASAFARLAWAVGVLHAEVIAGLLDGDGADLIVAHGQTVFHDPPLSWQLINPAPIAHRLGTMVITDLRQADLAAGGQGAPVTPVADWVLLRDARRHRAVVNLGGYCNVSILPAGPGPDLPPRLDGFDVCACNHLLDAVARTVLGIRFDAGGRAAAAGTADARLAEELQDELSRQHRPGRSLGTGDEHLAFLRRWPPAMDPSDVAATVVAAVAGCIAGRLETLDVDEIIVAGGGARNATLVRSLRARCRARVEPSDAFGIPVTAREAIDVAILGALSTDGVQVTTPAITGCTRTPQVAGTISGGHLFSSRHGGDA